MKTCVEREELWAAYNKALSEFSRCVDRLSATPVEDPHFKDKMRGCQDANEACKIARSLWEQHLRGHGC